MANAPPPSNETLNQALARHRAGALDEAEALYWRVLESEPDHPDALHLLGVARQQRQDFAASAALISRALAQRPDPAFATNLASAYLGLGRFAEAEQAARAALAKQPGLAMARTNLGVALHGQGRRREAAQILKEAALLDPGRPEAGASLGVVLLELGDRDAAVIVLRALVVRHPGYAPAHYNLGNAIAAVETPETLDEALACYDRAIALAPGYADAHTNRASLLRRQRRLKEAEAGYQTALALNPNSALAHYNHGLMLAEDIRPAEALVAYDRALALSPDMALAYSHRGNVLSALGRDDDAMASHQRALDLAPNESQVFHNLGLSFGHLNQMKDAVAHQRRALALKPDYAEAHAALASALAELSQTDEAMAEALRAIELDPSLGMAQTALAQVHMELDDLAAAEAALQRAIALRPRLAQAHVNLGVIRSRQGRFDEALELYDTAMALRPDLWESGYNRGTLRLQLGDYAKGWEGFEFRLKAPDRRRSDAKYPQPLWMDQPLAGKTILLHGEQGLGDNIQCVRFAPQVAALGARVILEIHPALIRLAETMPGVAQVIAPGEPFPPTDLRLPLFSLPHRMGASLDTLPGPIPYLDPGQALTEQWRGFMDRRAPRPAPRIGVVWSGNITARVDRGRSFPLSALAPLAQAAGAPLISLQKTYGLDQLSALPEGMEVLTLGEAYDAGDMADTAAVLRSLDLVVACDTGVAHLAGALGVPVWLAINANGDWRWLKDRADSPWYPSLRLYRQPTVGDWDGVFQAMARDWAVRPG
ncbi:MAG: tetratricopeptide repeat protein [Caulobacteraceae bacterium]|nr:tetratricopeptide repeat protein [Caulobacteraceae bacterium]